MFSLLAVAEMHISLKAEPLFKLGSVTITNSMLYGLICAAIIVLAMIIAARRVTLRPQKGLLARGVESLVEFVIKLLETPFGDRVNAARFAPIFGVYFVFIMFSNMLELVPWVGEGFYGQATHGAKTVLFRPFTADLNGTIALAVIAIVMVQILSVREQGVKKHAQHYFSNKPFNPINFFIGALELLGELTRVLSLSLRLFLNTAAGEVLIVIFTSIILPHGQTPLVVLPIFAFEALVAFIQAYVFTVLAGTYLGLAIAHAHDHDDDHSSAGSPYKVESGRAHAR